MAENVLCDVKRMDVGGALGVENPARRCQFRGLRGCMSMEQSVNQPE
ncbi:MAG: hypothetical protein LUF00_11100 [Lachnospiraceae bacterium]|nr:hypothetical protein [Lachnospiraceae bacterium]